MSPVVFYYSDGNDLDYLVASLRSVERNAQLDRPPIVFSDKPLDIEPPHQLEILQKLDLGQFDPTVYGEDKFVAVCMRIAAIDWLRERGFESAIYLDTDTIVLRRMALIESSLASDRPIGAVDDHAHLQRVITGHLSIERQTQPSVSVPNYFNSGVLALQLSKLPAGSMVEELKMFLDGTPAPAYPDQDFLNWYANKYDLLGLLPGECNAIASLLAMTSTTVEAERNRQWFLNEVEVAHYAFIKPDFHQRRSRLFFQMALDYLPSGELRDRVEGATRQLHPFVK